MRSSSCPAAVESLEERRLLAATVEGGILIVTGTARSDNINVSLDSGESSFRVRIRTGGAEDIQNVPLAGVTGIRILAGSGNDEVEVEDINEPGNLQLPVSVIGGNGNDSLHGSAGDDSVNGGNGNDSLIGHGGDDLLIGANGNDAIYGKAGDDSLNGGNGRDRCYGGLDDDSIIGGNGHDLLRGEDGDDSLFGGGGRDSMRGSRGRDHFFGIGREQEDRGSSEPENEFEED